MRKMIFLILALFPAFLLGVQAAQAMVHSHHDAGNPFLQKKDKGHLVCDLEGRHAGNLCPHVHKKPSKFPSPCVLKNHCGPLQSGLPAGSSASYSGLWAEDNTSRDKRRSDFFVLQEAGCAFHPRVFLPAIPPPRIS